MFNVFSGRKGIDGVIMCSMVVLILVKHGHMHLVGVRILVKTLNVSSGWNIF